MPERLANVKARKTGLSSWQKAQVRAEKSGWVDNDRKDALKLYSEIVKIVTIMPVWQPIVFISAFSPSWSEGRYGQSRNLRTGGCRARYMSGRG